MYASDLTTLLPAFELTLSFFSYCCFFCRRTEDGVRSHPEWMRTPTTIEQDVLSPSQLQMNTNVDHEDINPSFILDDGSVTEITQFTDLMRKQSIETEVYIVSKSFPKEGYSLVQNFRKIHNDETGIETYVRGECIEFPQRIVLKERSLEETLATFHIQRKLTSRLLFLSKPLMKRGSISFAGQKRKKQEDCQS